MPKPGNDHDRRLVLIGLPPWLPSEPPLGVAYLAERMRGLLWSVRVIDANLFLHDAVAEIPVARRLWRHGEFKAWSGARYLEECRPWLAPFHDELAERVAEYRPLLVGFSCITEASIDIAGDLLSRFRPLLPRAVFIAGGNGRLPYSAAGAAARRGRIARRARVLATGRASSAVPPVAEPLPFPAVYCFLPFR